MKGKFNGKVPRKYRLPQYGDQGVRPGCNG